MSKIFSWSDFFYRWGRILPPNAQIANEWRYALREEGDPALYDALHCARFLALAYWDSKNDNPCNRENIANLARSLGFNYNFTQYREQLRNQLKKHFAIELLRSQNGNYQYLRTLQIYSGKIYINFASAAAEVIQRSGNWERWLEKGKLENTDIFIRRAQIYIPNRNNNNDDTITLEDVADFFRKLIRLHLERGTEFTVSDIQRFASVTDEVAGAIIDQLYIPEQQNVNLAFAETGPIIELDENGNGVYHFPEAGNFPPETQSPVVFRIKKHPSDSDIDCLAVRYTKAENGAWRRELFPQCPRDGKFRMDKYHAIDLIYRGNENVCENKLPLICQQQDHILVRVKRDDNGRISLLIP